MIELIPFDDPSVLGARISGKIDKNDMARLIAKATEQFSHEDRVRVYVEVESFTGISLEALFEDLAFGFRNFRRFERKAVVSDSAWYTKVTPIFDKLFKNVQLRHFTPDQTAEAKAWVVS